MILPVVVAGVLGFQTSHTLTGDIVIIPGFESKALHNSRSLRVYLPRGYHHSHKRYPVLYMHDGQNIFDAALSPFSHHEWRADETTQSLIEAKLIEPIIIVGVDNNADRMDELTPTTQTSAGGKIAGGKGPLCVKFLVDEVKPFIDKTYRTEPGRKTTGVCGSSLGGLIDAFIAVHNSATFSKIGIMSPSVWWGNKEILKEVNAMPHKFDDLLWIDIGLKEGDPMVPDSATLADAFVAKGWKKGKNLWYFQEYDAEHTEQAWADRFPLMLLKFFPYHG